MSPRVSLVFLVSVLAASTGGCSGCGPPVLEDDAGRVAVPPPDGGAQPGNDAGRPDAGSADAGVKFKTGYADEPCPDEAYGALPPDAGLPDGTLIRGLCIAVTRFEGVATLDGAPVQAPVHLVFDGTSHQSELEVPVDAQGAFGLRVMRGRYDRLLLHPGELTNHAGPKDFGTVDLRKDQSRTLPVKTWHVAGATFFAGQPWPSTTQPPDLTLHADGAPNQSAWTSNTGGGYEVRLMEGQFEVKVSVPYASLGETQLVRYPVTSWQLLTEDRTIDIDLPTSELSGTFTIDGQPFPDRIPNGPDYRLAFTPQGGQEPVAYTIHEGGNAFFSAIVPKREYAINLELLQRQDPSLPSLLYSKQIAVGMDLTQNQTLNVNLATHKVEGALLIDGVPVVPDPGTAWTLYAGGRAGQSWFVAYYEVPFTSSAFSLRALPGEYVLALYLTGSLHPEFAEGWYIIDESRSIHQDISLPVDIQTQVLEGTLSIDGALAASEFTHVGTLWFETSTGSMRHRVRTTDGRFRVRLPQSTYALSFEPNAEAYPDYAVGREPLGVTVDMRTPQRVDLTYETVPVAGPLLFGQEAVPDALQLLPEMSLTLRSTAEQVAFTKDLHGGQPWYFLRIPRRDYRLTFELERDVLPDVAWGDTVLGNPLLLTRP